VRRGGYVLRDCAGQPELILIATGSEVPLATRAAGTLEKRGHRARVVSMPCTQVFESQESTYRESVLPASVRARLVLEAGVTPLWWQYAGPGGRILGIDRFGESAPQEVLFDYFGFTNEAIVAAAEALLESSSS
jgi:transketolase